MNGTRHDPVLEAEAIEDLRVGGERGEVTRKGSITVGARASSILDLLDTITGRWGSPPPFAAARDSLGRGIAFAISVAGSPAFWSFADPAVCGNDDDHSLPSHSICRATIRGHFWINVRSCDRHVIYGSFGPGRCNCRNRSQRRVCAPSATTCLSSAWCCPRALPSFAAPEPVVFNFGCFAVYAFGSRIRVLFEPHFGYLASLSRFLAQGC